MLFGNKENFAIEIEATKKPKMFKLCFWAKGIKIGLFTKAGILNHSVKAYKKFINNKENYYTALFDTMRPDDIPFYLLGLDNSTFTRNISSQEFILRESLYLIPGHFGDQFFNSSSDVFFLYKEPNVVLIICKKGILDATRQEVNFDFFNKVFEEYIGYCENNNLM